VATCGRAEKGTELGKVPFAIADLEHRFAGDVRGLDLKGFAERIAGGNHGKVPVEKQKRRI
jgi:hypothetical protein